MISIMPALSFAPPFVFAWLRNPLPMQVVGDGNESLLRLALIGGAAFGLLVGLLIGWLIWQVLQGRARKIVRSDIEKARQEERNRQRLVFDLISGLGSTLIYNKVLDMTLDLSIKALSAYAGQPEKITGAVLLFSEEGGGTQLRVASARRLTLADTRLMLPATEGVLARVINNAETVLCKDVASDPELRRLIGLRENAVVYCVPLRRAPDTYGLILYGHSNPDFFSATQREIADIAAHQAVIALQNAMLYNDLEQEKERMLQIQEEARKKLARDLHDGPTQSVAALAMRANFTRRLLDRDVKEAANELVKIEELARRTTKEIRHMLFTLRPLVLESDGLAVALQLMAEKMFETYGQQVRVAVDPAAIEELEMGRQTVLFYIAEEAVNNARKHAQAAEIWVRISKSQPEVVLLEIQDNGVGFNLGSVDANYERRGSLGMVNMRERAELVNGVLQINSAEGQGTTIWLQVPLTEDAGERLRKGK